jgi:hypothetical protein
VMRYLKGTIDYGLRYISDREIRLQGYTDSDWAGSVTDQKSTSGCCFSLGSVVISWLSKKQTCVVLSSAEAEYVATCSACGEAVWLREADYRDCLISSWRQKGPVSFVTSCQRQAWCGPEGFSLVRGSDVFPSSGK